MSREEKINKLINKWVEWGILTFDEVSEWNQDIELLHLLKERIRSQLPQN